MIAIFIEARAKESTDIFKHDCARLNFLDKTDGLREEVSFVFLPELLSRNGERRTRDTASQQIDAAVWTSVKIVNVCTNDVPLWAVLLQYFAIIFFVFNKCYMDKACYCKT